MLAKVHQKKTILSITFLDLSYIRGYKKEGEFQITGLEYVFLFLQGHFFSDFTYITGSI